VGGLVALLASLFDMLDGRVARLRGRPTTFGAFLDSTMDRYSDMVLYMGLMVLYARIDRTPHMVLVWVAAFGSFMTSYARARAESLIPSCPVGYLERPERIVLLMIGACTNRMAAVLLVVLALSVLTVANRIYFTYLALNRLPMPTRAGVRGFFTRAFFWTDERATLPYDLWVIAILAFVWLTPPDWLGDPTASGPGLIGLLVGR
jgi:CDP-diacylglycerol--glycerol-3-phosphate 3-phosphatidyltransferase